MKDKLTEKQLFIYYLIKTYIERNGYGPTIRELCKMAELSSTATMFTYLKTLKRKGYIDYIPNASRTLKIIKNVED